MNFFTSLSEVFTQAFQNILMQVVEFAPIALGALIVFVVGLILASWLGALVRRLVHLTKIDSLIEKSGINQTFKHAGVTFSLSGLLGWIVKWFLILVVLIAVIDILQWQQVSQFLNSVVLYVPNVIVAVLILGIGFVASRFVKELIEKAIKASDVPVKQVGLLGSIAEWAIVIFAFLAALIQLGIAPNLLQVLFTGVVAALALGFGLAFGLGGQEHASRFLDRIHKDSGGKK